MRKCSVLLMSLFITSATLHAQNLHVTLFGGFSNYQGDMQDKKFTLQESHPAGGVGVKYEITEQLSARANVNFGTVSADDKKSTNIHILERNLNFTTNITDIHLGLEYDLVNIYEHGFAPYIFAGVSVFTFNPYTHDSLGQKVYLQPLGTEGQGFYNGRKKYDLTQLAIPLGGGVKIAMSDNFTIGVEVGFRKLFTDYIDDLSMSYADQNQLLANNGPKAVELAFRGDELNKGLKYPPINTIRGNPKSKDWYYFSGITLAFRIVPGDEKYYSGKERSGKSRVNCPTRIL